MTGAKTIKQRHHIRDSYALAHFTLSVSGTGMKLKLNIDVGQKGHHFESQEISYNVSEIFSNFPRETEGSGVWELQ